MDGNGIDKIPEDLKTSLAYYFFIMEWHKRNPEDLKVPDLRFDNGVLRSELTLRPSWLISQEPWPRVIKKKMQKRGAIFWRLYVIFTVNRCCPTTFVYGVCNYLNEQDVAFYILKLMQTVHFNLILSENSLNIGYHCMQVWKGCVTDNVASSAF